MSHQSAKRRGHSKGYPCGHGKTGASLDGRLAYDIVEAAWVLKSGMEREARLKKEAAQRKVPITLAVMPWDEREGV